MGQERLTALSLLLINIENEILINVDKVPNDFASKFLTIYN